MTRAVPAIGEAGYARRGLDDYATPTWCAEALFSRVRFRGTIWEPACGRGDIVKAARTAGYETMASDIADYGFPCALTDFLEHGSPGDGSVSIVTNPPYANAEAFVRHALKLAGRSSGMVAMLLRHEYDCAATRRDLFDKPPFRLKLTLTKRPRWFAEKGSSPRHNFSWFLWDWNYGGRPTLEYAP